MQAAYGTAIVPNYDHSSELVSRNDSRNVELENRLLFQIQNLDSIHVSARYRGLSLPWKREDLPAKIYSSLGLQYQWSWVEALPIRGLTPSTTIGDVIRWLDGKNCSFLATGPAVWETLHQVKPLRISGETSCTLTQLYSWCMEKFPAHSCGLYPLEDEVTGYRLEIGDARTNS